MIGIYKIENLLNSNKYIGQSIDIGTRWKHHKQVAYNQNDKGYNYPLYRAIRKYGIENFKFDIIEECEKNELNERETYWISYYDSFFHGYNQTLGGDGSVSKCTDKQIICKILELLETTDITHSEIAKQCNISIEMVQGINTGRYWHDSHRNYPIRQRKTDIVKNYCVDCGKEILKSSVRCIDCYNKNIKKDKPNKEVLLELILTTTFVKIGEMYGVSDNSVRKWCIAYGLPYKYKDIKKIKNMVSIA